MGVTTRRWVIGAVAGSVVVAGTVLAVPVLFGPRPATLATLTGAVPAEPAPPPTEPSPTAPAPPAPAATFTGDCTVTELPFPAEVTIDFTNTIDYLDVGEVADLDASGRYVVGHVNHHPYSLILLWDRGVPTAVSTALAIGSEVEAAAINSRGVAVGGLRRGWASDYTEHAWRLVDGVWTVLRTPSGYDNASARAINDHGDIVGVAGTRGGAAVAVVWEVGTGYAPRILPAPGNAVATGIAADGTIAGYAGVAGPVMPYLYRDAGGQPYVWTPDGTGRTLPLPPGEEFGEVAQVRGDWATGSVMHQDHSANEPQPVYTHGTARWNLHTGEVFTHHWAHLPRVNGHGDVVEVPTGDINDGAVLTRDGRRYELPHPHQWGAASPVALSDDATVILGSFRLWDGPSGLGILWRC
jgi:hypothetical protein